MLQILEKSNPQLPQTLFHRMGVLRALGLIFKHGKREELLDFAPYVVAKFFSSKIPTFSDTPIRKFSMKLIQRIGKNDKFEIKKVPSRFFLTNTNRCLLFFCILMFIRNCLIKDLF